MASKYKRWMVLSFTEMGTLGKTRCEWDITRGYKFSLEQVEFEVPLRHTSLDVE